MRLCSLGAGFGISQLIRPLRLALKKQKRFVAAGANGVRGGRARRAPKAAAVSGGAANGGGSASKRRLSESLLLIFDTETTGIDVAQDRVVQLGAVYWRGRAMVGPRRSMLVNPGVPIPVRAVLRL